MFTFRSIFKRSFPECRQRNIYVEINCLSVSSVVCLVVRQLTIYIKSTGTGRGLEIYIIYHRKYCHYKINQI